MNVEDAGNNEDTTSKNSQSREKNAKNYKTQNQQLINITVRVSKLQERKKIKEILIDHIYIKELNLMIKSVWVDAQTTPIIYILRKW